MTCEAFLEQLLDLLPTSPPPSLISAYVQGRRIMPSSTPFPGPWENARTSYLVEIMDCMALSSPVQHVVLMASAQVGKTAAAESVAAFYLDACPSEVLFATATEELAEEWSTKRLDPLIDSLGFRHKVGAQVNAAKSRRTGDKVFSKQVAGGSINIVSAQSAASLRSASKRVLIRDEIDGAPPELRSGEGGWLEVSEARTNAWGARKKIFDVSTPKTFEASEINHLYELGDCRKYLLPCPKCRKPQELVFGNDQTRHGLKGMFAKDGTLIEAVYVCEHCHEEIRNHQKTEMLALGHWEPTKKSSDPGLRSYHISALYSPVGMLSWTDVYRKHLASREDPEAQRAFTNLVLGLPFKESGARPELRTVIALRGAYRQGTIPGRMVGDRWQGPLYLTCGIDVQRGKERDDTLGPRLELEILGIGAGYRTWSILYKVIHGAVDDPFSGAWELLNQWAVQGFVFPQMEVYHGGQPEPMRVGMVFIDSGDNSEVIYRFCRQWGATLPSKGLPIVTPDPRKRERADIPGSNYKKYRVANVGGDQVIVEINTRFYKRIIYSNLKIARSATEPQPPGFCDFPFERDEEYFSQLTAEEMRSDGSFHKIRGRNEALDNRVMALCASDVYLDGIVRDHQNMARSRGANLAQMQVINGRWVLDRLAASIRPKSIEREQS
jgi:phage terminase large subunit GpA-like protein